MWRVSRWFWTCRRLAIVPSAGSAGANDESAHHTTTAVKLVATSAGDAIARPASLVLVHVLLVGLEPHAQALEGHAYLGTAQRPTLLQLSGKSHPHLTTSSMATTAYSVPASGWFGGSDGWWSAFDVQIADSLSSVNLLPGSSTSAIWVVSAPQECPALSASDCASSRGGTVDFTSLSGFSWLVGTKASSIIYLPFDSQQQLGKPYVDGHYIAYSVVGSVTLGGSTGQKLSELFIFDNPTTIPYVGLLGLGPGPNNPPVGSNTVELDSPLGALASGKDQLLTSQSWAYTAGAYYRAQQYPGSLTFGGYDAARRDMDSILTVTMGSQPERDLVVNIEQISFGSTSADQAPVTLKTPAFIDTVVPEMWLPRDYTLAFETAFNLEYDSDMDLYLIDDTQHNDLLIQNPSVEIILSAESPNASASVTINLSYNSFYQPLSWPLTGRNDSKTLHYFALRTATDENQFTIGRVFLQEAYLAVDYHHKEFYLSQALFPADQTKSTIVTVQPSGTFAGATITSQPHHDGRKNDGMSTGEIVGIVVGVVGGLAIIAGLIWWFVWRPRSKRREEERQRAQGPPPDRDMVGYYGEEDKDGGYASSNNTWAKQEMDASQPARASIANRSELPSPPPLPQYSPRTPRTPGSLASSGTPGSPGSGGWHRHPDSVESAGDYLSVPHSAGTSSPGPYSRGSVEIGGHYGTVRRSGGAMSPVELSADGERQRGPPPAEIP